MNLLATYKTTWPTAHIGPWYEMTVLRCMTWICTSSSIGARFVQVLNFIIIYIGEELSCAHPSISRIHTSKVNSSCGQLSRFWNVLMLCNQFSVWDQFFNICFKLRVLSAMLSKLSRTLWGSQVPELKDGSVKVGSGIL